jgi:hypothetical protein
MYKIMGADQREYGPVASEGVREWIAQGRANGQTLASFEGAPWKPLSTFPEFADALRTASPPPISGTPYAGGPQRSNTPAVAGLVCSILGLCCLPLSLVGLGLCIAGLLQIKKTPQAYSTSIAVPIIGIVLGVFAILMNIVALTSGAFHEMIRNLPR